MVAQAQARWLAPSGFGKNVAEGYWAGKELIAGNSPVFADVVAKSAAVFPVRAGAGRPPQHTGQKLIATLPIR
jgi:hypothetical protein